MRVHSPVTDQRQVDVIPLLANAKALTEMGGPFVVACIGLWKAPWLSHHVSYCLVSSPLLLPHPPSRLGFGTGQYPSI